MEDIGGKRQWQLFLHLNCDQNHLIMSFKNSVLGSQTYLEATALEFFLSNPCDFDDGPKLKLLKWEVGEPIQANAASFRTQHLISIIYSTFFPIVAPSLFF